MSNRSRIEWTEATWNPTTGCDQVSPGCDNCYALAMARRLKAMGVAKYQNDGNEKTSGPGFALTCHEDTLGQPYRWKTPRLVFVNSMSDLFHRDVPETFIRAVFTVMAETPQHTYQLLTKRSKRMARLADKLDWPPNVWVGVSVETDDFVWRARDLASVDGAAVRFLSCEPLLGPLPSLCLDNIDWVIAGGESGPAYRPVELTWVQSLRDKCAEDGVAFFFKQWGGRTPKSGGRELDGRLHDAMPERTSA